MDYLAIEDICLISVIYSLKNLKIILFNITLPAEKDTLNLNKYNKSLMYLLMSESVVD